MLPPLVRVSRSEALLRATVSLQSPVITRLSPLPHTECRLPPELAGVHPSLHPPSFPSPALPYPHVPPRNGF